MLIHESLKILIFFHFQAKVVLLLSFFHPLFCHWRRRPCNRERAFIFFSSVILMHIFRLKFYILQLGEGAFTTFLIYKLRVNILIILHALIRGGGLYHFKKIYKWRVNILIWEYSFQAQKPLRGRKMKLKMSTRKTGNTEVLSNPFFHIF